MRLAQQARRRPIGLTPLIDVVFLLLVFFLLASTFAREDVMTIRLSGAGAPGVPIETPVRIALGADGTVSIDGAAMDLHEIAERVLPLAEEGRAVIVVPEEDVSLDAIVAVLDALTRGGVSGVSLAR